MEHFTLNVGGKSSIYDLINVTEPNVILIMCIFISLCILSVPSGTIALSDTFFPSRRTEGLHVEF